MWNLCVTVLILGFTSGVYMETCPPSVDIRPCICKSKEKAENILIKCKGNRVKAIDVGKLNQALKGLSGKSNVDLVLSYVKINTLSTDLFSGIDIKKLSIYHCDLDSLTNDDQPGLQGLENHLEELIIDECFMRGNGSAKLNLGHLKKLKNLELVYNLGIKEIGDDWFSNGPFSLETLEIWSNGIRKLGIHAFSELSNLKKLYLIGNDFGPIKRSMLPTTANKLQKLKLENNQWTDLPKDIFSRMPSIYHISLERNQLSTIDESTWSPIWQQLQKLYLQGNKIHCDDRLKWISKMEKKPFIIGKCHEPQEFYRKNLRYFIESLNQ